MTVTAAKKREVGPMAVIECYHEQVKKRFPQRYNPKVLPTTKLRSDIDRAVEFLTWCEQNAVEHPLHFIEIYFAYLYAKSKGHLRPKFSALCAPDLVPVYSEMIDGVLLHYRLSTAPENDPERLYYRGLALNTPVHESVRRDYVLSQQTQLCFEQPGLSGSFHPASQWCGRCPLAHACAQRLNEREGFDVSALRANRPDLIPNRIRLLVIG